MGNLVKLETPELLAIEPSKAEQIKSTFEPMIQMLQEFELTYNQIISDAEKGINADLISKAKRLRIDIGKVRINTEKLRKEQKEEYLRAGKAIDGVSNILKWAVSEKENKLKEIEKYFEIQEQKRLEKLQNDRAEQLSKYVEDAYERDLSGMDEDVWNAYYNAKKQAYIDKIEAEKKAEAERIAKEKAEKAERERIRKENERLKKEAEERERLAKIEADKRAKAEKAEKEAREKAEKLKAELKAKEEKERKEQAEKERLLQLELSKGDADKVKDLILDLEALKHKYTFKSAKNKKMYKGVNVLIDKIIAYINN